jgi:Zn-finger nucleic acid-binding protein
MNCLSCGAPMHLKPDQDCFQCDFCHSVYLLEKDSDGVRVLGEACAESCPICSVPLVDATLAGTRIAYCNRCHGMLIPMEVLQSLVEDLRSTGGNTVAQPPADAGDLQRKIGCPRCRRTMDAHYYSGPGNVVIDSCENCSLDWLDRGELMHIVHAPDSNQGPQLFGLVDDFDTAAAVETDAVGDFLWSSLEGPPDGS